MSKRVFRYFTIGTVIRLSIQIFFFFFSINKSSWINWKFVKWGNDYGKKIILYNLQLENMSSIMCFIRLNTRALNDVRAIIEKENFLSRCKQQPDMELWLERCDRKRRMSTHVLTRYYQKLVTFLSCMSSATSKNIDEKRIS
jgi:hypothetical protein